MFLKRGLHFLEIILKYLRMKHYNVWDLLWNNMESGGSRGKVQRKQDWPWVDNWWHLMTGVWWFTIIFGEHNTELKNMAERWFHHRLNVLMVWHKESVLAEFIKSCRLPVQASIYIIGLGWIKILTWRLS